MQLWVGASGAADSAALDCAVEPLDDPGLQDRAGRPHHTAKHRRDTRLLRASGFPDKDRAQKGCVSQSHHSGNSRVPLGWKGARSLPWGTAPCTGTEEGPSKATRPCAPWFLPYCSPEDSPPHCSLGDLPSHQLTSCPHVSAFASLVSAPRTKGKFMLERQTAP